MNALNQFWLTMSVQQQVLNFNLCFDRSEPLTSLEYRQELSRSLWFVMLIKFTTNTFTVDGPALFPRQSPLNLSERVGCGTAQIDSNQMINWGSVMGLQCKYRLKGYVQSETYEGSILLSRSSLVSLQLGTALTSLTYLRIKQLQPAYQIFDIYLRSYKQYTQFSVITSSANPFSLLFSKADMDLNLTVLNGKGQAISPTLVSYRQQFSGGLNLYQILVKIVVADQKTIKATDFKYQTSFGNSLIGKFPSGCKVLLENNVCIGCIDQFYLSKNSCVKACPNLAITTILPFQENAMICNEVEVLPCRKVLSLTGDECLDCENPLKIQQQYFCADKFISEGSSVQSKLVLVFSILLPTMIISLSLAFILWKCYFGRRQARRSRRRSSRSSSPVINIKEVPAVLPFAECVICLQPVEDVMGKLPCNHKQFHVQCLKDWSRKQTNCPVCRLNILKPSIPQQPQQQIIRVAVQAEQEQVVRQVRDEEEQRAREEGVQEEQEGGQEQEEQQQGGEEQQPWGDEQANTERNLAQENR